MVLIGAAATMGSLRAQSAAADQAWASVSNLAKPVGLVRAVDGKAKTPDELKADIKQQGARRRLASQGAHDFYTDYPSHPKAQEARKVEAVAAIQGVESGNAAQEQAAFALGKAFRENKSYPLLDRFEVALAMDRLDLSLRIKNRKAMGRAQDWKALGDKLKTEFGDIPAVHAYYMEIARTADRATAIKIAAEVGQSSIASPAAKSQARVILDREALVGKNITLTLSTTEGGSFDLAQQKNKVTVIFAWSPEDSSSLSSIKRFEKSLPSDGQIVYLAMGGSPSQVKKGKGDAILPGTHCHAPAGPQSQAANTGLKLLYSPLPRIYVLNRSGLLVGYGRVEDLPALIGKVNGGA